MKRRSGSVGLSRAVQPGQARANRGALRHLSNRSRSIASCRRSLEPGRLDPVRPQGGGRKLLRYARIGCTSKRRQYGLLQSRRAALHDAVHPRLRYIGVCVDPSSGFRVIDIWRIPKEIKIEQKKNITQEPLHPVSVDSGNSSARAARAGYFA